VQAHDLPVDAALRRTLLMAPAMMEDGSLVARDQGTPQGGVISPLLANLFLHYVFDVRLRRGFPVCRLKRYADDIVCHCRTEREALVLRDVLDRRFSECGLVLHPEKTKLVYCKDTNRKVDHAVTQFDFLGYTFRPRLAKWRGGLFGVSFLPAASPKALKAIERRSGMVIADPERQALDDWPDVQPVHPWLDQLLQSLLQVGVVSDASPDRRLPPQMARRKFRRLRHQPRGARNWLARVIRTSPDLLPTGSFCLDEAEHWEPYEREVHVRFWERAGVNPPRDSLAVASPGSDLCPLRCDTGSFHVVRLVGRARWWLTPLYERILGAVLASPRVFADDTNCRCSTWPRQDEYRPVWCYAVDNRPCAAPVIPPPLMRTARTGMASTRPHI